MVVWPQTGRTEICGRARLNGEPGSSLCTHLKVVVPFDVFVAELSSQDVAQGEKFQLTAYPSPATSDLCVMVHADASDYIQAYGSFIFIYEVLF